MKTVMPTLEVKLYFYQLFQSLAYIHSQGIRHTRGKACQIKNECNRFAKFLPPGHHVTPEGGFIRSRMSNHRAELGW
jgi:serine/threonine protein kinase